MRFPSATLAANVFPRAWCWQARTPRRQTRARCGWRWSSARSCSIRFPSVTSVMLLFQLHVVKQVCIQEHGRASGIDGSAGFPAPLQFVKAEDLQGEGFSHDPFHVRRNSIAACWRPSPWFNSLRACRHSLPGRHIAEHAEPAGFSPRRWAAKQRISPRCCKRGCRCRAAFLSRLLPSSVSLVRVRTAPDWSNCGHGARPGTWNESRS